MSPLLRSIIGREALFSLAALLLCALLVQTLYATLIRPRAAAILALPAPAEAPEAGPQASGPAHPSRNLRSVFVILKDYEQETALILACWALSLIAYQALSVRRNRRLLAMEYVGVAEGHVVLPEDARAYARPLEGLPRDEQDM